MIKSIQQFHSDGVKKLEKVFSDYSSDMTKIAEMAQKLIFYVISKNIHWLQ